MGTWVMPETQEDRDQVDKILSKPLPCGKDGETALDAIANLIGDDELSDSIILRSERNPRYLANHLIREKLREWSMMDGKGKWIKGNWDGNIWRPKYEIEHIQSLSTRNLFDYVRERVILQFSDDEVRRLYYYTMAQVDEDERD